MNPANGPVSADLAGKDAKAAHRTGAAGPPRVGVESRRRLALANCAEVRLDETAALLVRYPVRVSTHLLDVGDARAVGGAPAQVLQSHPGVDILINNAGVALGGRFEQVRSEDFEWLFSINFWGVVNMTRAFLPALRQSPEGQIVNLSSVFGLIAPPGQTAYSASKFAIRGFSMALRHELAENSNIGVTVVHPGGVATRIAIDARVSHQITPEEHERYEERFRKLLSMPPHNAAEAIVRGIEKRKTRILVGSDAKFASLIERIAPASRGTSRAATPTALASTPRRAAVTR